MNPASAHSRTRQPLGRDRGRWALVLLGSGALLLLLGAPLAAIFGYALQDGWRSYVANLWHADTRHAIGLSLLTAGIAVPVNLVFALCATWAITKFRFTGKRVLVSLIELPLSVSPIVLGVAFLFVFGMQGLFGPWLADHGVKLVFNIPAIVLVTTFVTTPLIVRELLPLMEAQGPESEIAATVLGANGWQTFWRVTFPSIKWGLLYGVTLCFARCLGEFGSVYIVSGAVRGETNTMTLHIDLLYHDYKNSGAFAVASVLTLFALVTLIVKRAVEWRETARLEAQAQHPTADLARADDPPLPPRLRGENQSLS